MRPDPHKRQARLRWLQPYTRWATRYAMDAPQWLPAIIRHLPLRLASLVLRCSHWLAR